MGTDGVSPKANARIRDDILTDFLPENTVTAFDSIPIAHATPRQAKHILANFKDLDELPRTAQPREFAPKYQAPAVLAQATIAEKHPSA